jgi:predicted MPP superfamily phosphohydrolase
MGFRGFLGWAGLVLLVAGFAVAGMVAAQRAAGPSERAFALGTVEISATPALGGGVDVYIPIVDWGVRAQPYRVPLDISLEFRSLDRDAALTAIRSGESARAELVAVEDDLGKVVRAELRRTAVFAVIGGAAGGLLAGIVVAARRGRHWVVIGAIGGAVTALAAVGIFALDLSRTNYAEAIREPTFYAHGEELPQLVDFSSQLLAVTDRYTESFDQAVAGLTNLVAAASGGVGLPATAATVALASDLHSNTFVLPVVRRYTQSLPVFLVGDFSQLGTELEEPIATTVATLSDTVVAVSGNHDTRPLMLALARAGVTVLTRDGRLRPDDTVDGDPIVDVAGLAVAGYDDPLARAATGIADHELELSPEDLEEESERIVAWFDGLPERPDVVLVHQHALAHALLDSLDPDDSRVIVLTGHDHEAHYHLEGPHLLLDGGTLGAGGPFAIGEEPASFALLSLDDQLAPLAVDLIGVEPLSGSGSVQRIVLSADA